MSTLFVLTLVTHVAAGLMCVVAGALAATARKRPGRHPLAGLVYLWGLVAVFATATTMSAIRWGEDRHLFAIAVVAMSLGTWGWWSRRRHRPGWVIRHGWGMGGSYIALLTGFYVDNGARLPVWDRLPHLTYWLLPTCVGVPLILLALHRFRAGISARPRPGPRTGQ